MAKAVKPPAPKTGSPSEDLIPRSMLPESSVIPEWRQFGYGATAPAAPKPAPKKGGKYKGGTIKKMAGGGSTGSASKRADGCAVKGKTRGKFV